MTDPSSQHTILNRELNLTPSDRHFIQTHHDHPTVQAFLTFYTAYCTQPSNAAMALLTITLADTRKLIRDTSLQPLPLCIPHP